ncbi:MAG: hypothetical protein CL569_07120 [Alphaproteobacteria bacterium]|nr:hypothetical protein [Alphaproteobacteria bacterium]|tara:strand:- start:701 stop:895 length:195 start_codon:yes stop_codon:yes gene_type:complete
MELPRDDLIRLIGYALWRYKKIVRRNASLDDMRVLATRVVDHLEISFVEWRRKPPRSPHSTKFK